MGRFVTRDPIGYKGGINLYGFAGNNPVNRSDPSGFDGSSPWKLGWEWVTGTGETDRNFQGGDPMTEQLREHYSIKNQVSGIESLLKKNELKQGDNKKFVYTLAGWKGPFIYAHDAATVLTGGLAGNLTVTFLGSYSGSWKVESINQKSRTAQIAFHAFNASGARSGTRFPVTGYMNRAGIPTATFEDMAHGNFGLPSGILNDRSTGKMRTTTQTFDWRETVHF